MKSSELKWGLIIGTANLVWLYGSYYLGLHTRGLLLVQAMVAVNLLVTLTGFILALRDIASDEPGITFLEGLKSGVVIAVVTAVIAAVAQVGYLKLVNPGWTEFMVEETRRHYEASDVPPEQVEAFARQAETTFGLQTYVVQAAVGAFLVGVVFTAVVMAARRLRSRL
ncbi:MAG: DUF4199 domain-containing protein [Verrucomicrobiales bacterium]